MTRKHFIAVAASIRREVDAATAADDSTSLATLQRLTDELARTFKQANSNFRFDTFRTACGF